jgi:hypothetical protein
MSPEEENGTIISSERRHRIHGEEVPEVIEGLRLRLRQHLKTRGDLLGATVAFMVLYRLVTHQAGRPDYPEPVTWSLIESWINGTIYQGGVDPEDPSLGSVDDDLPGDVVKNSFKSGGQA